MNDSQHPKPDTQNQPRLRRVAVDFVPLRVGEGGTGSGIWTYARELLHAMDRQVPEGLDVVCFVNEGQLPYLAEIQNIRLVPFAGGAKKGILSRLCWIHLKLPIACRRHRVDVLHKLATENPLVCPAKRITTVHDFYYEYLLEQQPKGNIRLYERLENLYFSWVTRICFRKSHAIIAVSQATCDEAVKRYPYARDRITVIHHGAPDFRGRRAEVSDQKSETSAQISANPEQEMVSHRDNGDIGESGINDHSAGSVDSVCKKNVTEAISHRDNGDIGESGINDHSGGSVDSVCKKNVREAVSHRDSEDRGENSLSTNNNQPATDRESAAFTILCVAKFMEHKGQHLLIAAYEAMLGRHPQLDGRVVLRMRGFHNDVDYYNRVCRQIEQSPCRSSIVLEPFNAADSLEAIYRGADLVVLLSDYEGFGLPVLEAQGMGIPVLCSDLPVLRETGGTGAVYVRRGDADQVAEALFRFISDPAWRENQLRRALDNPARFSWHDAARRTLEVYQGV